MSRIRLWSLFVAVASTAGIAGCSSGSSTPPTSASTTAPSTPGAGSGAGAVTAIPTQDLSPAGTAGTAPTVTVPSGSPPTQLESADLIVGTGPAAKAGDSLTVQYVLATYSTHQVVQSSWTGQPFSFPLGQHQVIPGWDEGVVGMRAGGRRELIIPPSLAYGSTPQGAGIAANDTLVFVIDLLKIG